jgi:hypothetical protein
LQALHDRVEELRALLEPEADLAPAARWSTEVELAVAKTDALEAAARLTELEYLAGVKSETLPAAPAPAPVIQPPAGPKRPGPKQTCTRNECRARERMRAVRVARKAAAG